MCFFLAHLIHETNTAHTHTHTRMLGCANSVSVCKDGRGSMFLAYIHTCMHAFMYAYTHSFFLNTAQLCRRVFRSQCGLHTFIHACMHTCMHTPACMHTCMHIPILIFFSAQLCGRVFRSQCGFLQRMCYRKVQKHCRFPKLHRLPSEFFEYSRGKHSMYMQCWVHKGLQCSKWHASVQALFDTTVSGLYMCVYVYMYVYTLLCKPCSKQR
jgi:hypothetical protein